jgi:ribosomal protein S18 acetylase RimI-like enzyme
MEPYPALEPRGIELRAARQEDAGFLYGLLKATMQEYVAQIWGWDEEWQRACFQERFDPSREWIVVLEGEAIGVLAIRERKHELFLAKISILPEYQGQGLGTQLIRAVLARAFGCGLPVTLRVLKGNPARGLYERLGFVAVGETETHTLMKATPDGKDCDG